MLNKIKVLTEKFTQDILEIIRTSSMTEMMEFAAGASRAAAGAVPVRGVRETVRKPRAAKAGRLARRSSEDIVATADKIIFYVKEHPGARSEMIRAALKLDKREWLQPIAVALGDGLMKKGEKRATEYFYIGGATASSSKKPAAKKSSAKKIVKSSAKKPAAKKSSAKKIVKSSAKKIAKASVKVADVFPPDVVNGVSSVVDTSLAADDATDATA